MYPLIHHLISLLVFHFFLFLMNSIVLVWVFLIVQLKLHVLLFNKSYKITAMYLIKVIENSQNDTNNDGNEYSTVKTIITRQSDKLY